MTFLPRMKRFLLRLRPSREQGQTLVEYGLIVTLLAMAAVVILTALGGDVVGLFTGLSTRLQDATSTA